jgi:hypothetical protein
MKRETVQIGMQCRAASVAPSTIDTDKRTIELVWSTGAEVKRADFWTGEQYIEKLAMGTGNIRMGRLNGGAPLLNTHGRYDLGDIIGVVEKAWIANGEGRAVVRFSNRADVQPIWQDVQDGIIRNVSVGYNIHKFEDVTEKGEKVRTYLATDWEPSEISLVPIGADAKAGVRSDNPCEVFTEVSEQSESAEERSEATGEAAPNAQADGANLLDYLRLQVDFESRR